MADHPMAAKYREGTKAMEEGRFQEAADMMSDDIVWWQIGSAEPLRGKQALMESMGNIADYDIKVDLHDVVANDEHIVALVTATATKDGKTLHIQDSRDPPPQGRQDHRKVGVLGRHRRDQ